MTDETKSKAPQMAVCRTCNSTEVCSDAVAKWSVSLQAWELCDTHDCKTCEMCQNESNWCEFRDATPDEIAAETPTTEPEALTVHELQEQVDAMAAALRYTLPQLEEYCTWHEKRGGCSVEMLEARDRCRDALATVQ